MLDNLPDTVLGHLLSFLHWKEKETLSIASIRVSKVLWSSYGWHHFENTRQCSSLFKHGPFKPINDHEKSVVRTFGKYFQHCKLWLHLSDFREEDDGDKNILQLVAHHCEQLKSLCLVHPCHVSYHEISRCPESYLEPLRALVFKRKGKCTISLTRLFYRLKPSDQSYSGFEKYLRLLVEHYIYPVISCFDVLVGDLLITSPSGNDVKRPPFDLTYFYYLRILKCPVHLLNTDIITCLIKGHLAHLYLINNLSTRKVNFIEKYQLDWLRICSNAPEEKRSRFHVHYIFQNRFLQASNLCPNPFVKSVVFSNLSNNISSSFSHQLADVYGPFLHTLAFYNSLWGEQVMFFSHSNRLDNSITRLSRKCTRLKVFLCSVPITSSSLLNFVVSSESLVHLRVYRDSIILLPRDKPFREFCHKISVLLGRKDWIVDRYNSSNIFDIPGVDTLLFTTCDT